MYQIRGFEQPLSANALPAFPTGAQLTPRTIAPKLVVNDEDEDGKITIKRPMSARRQEAEFLRKKMKPLPMCVRPIMAEGKDGAGFINYTFHFPALVVRPSEQGENAGLGVFVRRGYRLKVGDAIPFYGPKLSLDAKHHPSTNGNSYLLELPDGLIDASPTIDAYNGVGSRGLGIAALVNEASPPFTYNCHIVDSFIMVTTEINGGQELLVYYGDGYGDRPYPVAKETPLLAPNREEEADDATL